MTSVDQWQAGRAVEGFPPWDGTGFPFPLGEDGNPDLPGALTITEPQHGATDVDPLVTVRGTGAEPGATVDLYADSHDGGNTAVASVTADDEGAFEFVGSTPFEVSPESIAVGVGDLRSPKITFHLAQAAVLEGWTIAELKEFAADHDPPIAIPSSATKPQIIALILAALAEDDDEPDEPAPDAEPDPDEEN